MDSLKKVWEFRVSKGGGKGPNPNSQSASFKLLYEGRERAARERGREEGGGVRREPPERESRQTARPADRQREKHGRGRGGKKRERERESRQRAARPPESRQRAAREPPDQARGCRGGGARGVQASWCLSECVGSARKIMSAHKQQTSKQANMASNIALHGGWVATVDPEDAPMLQKHKWHWSNGYAVSGTGERMHHMVMGGKPTDGRVVDHINDNKLDNRKDNLQFATYAENAWKARHISKYTGVHWNHMFEMWKATIGIKGRTVQLGMFCDELCAARARDEALSVLAPSLRRKWNLPGRTDRVLPDDVLQTVRDFSQMEQLCKRIAPNIYEKDEGAAGYYATHKTTQSKRFATREEAVAVLPQLKEEVRAAEDAERTRILNDADEQTEETLEEKQPTEPLEWEGEKPASLFYAGTSIWRTEADEFYLLHKLPQQEGPQIVAYPVCPFELIPCRSLEDAIQRRADLAEQDGVPVKQWKGKQEGEEATTREGEEGEKEQEPITITTCTTTMPRKRKASAGPPRKAPKAASPKPKPKRARTTIKKQYNTYADLPQYTEQENRDCIAKMMAILKQDGYKVPSNF